MMNEIEFGFGFQLAALALVLLLIIILIFFIVRRKISKKKKTENDLKIPVLVEEAEPLSDTGPKKESIVESKAAALSSSEPLVEIPTTKTIITPVLENLPQDSMLRRHAVTHLYALVESNMPLRPTDSVLRRHYDTMIENEVKKLL